MTGTDIYTIKSWMGHGAVATTGRYIHVTAEHLAKVKSPLDTLYNYGKSETKRILDKIEKELSERADTYPTLKGPFAGLRKLRVGDYRVVFAIAEQDVIVLRIGHRRKIYK